MKISFKQIKLIITEELKHLLKEQNDVLRDLISSEIGNPQVIRYGDKITKDVQNILNANLSKIKEPTYRQKIQGFSEYDPQGALELLRSLFKNEEIEFTQAEKEQLVLIDEWPQDAEIEDKREFLINKKLKQKDYSGFLIRGADFGDSDLSMAKMQNTAIRGCDLSMTTGLKSADMAGASCDLETKWPPGFDPEQSGIKVVMSGIDKGFCKKIPYQTSSKVMRNYYNSSLSGVEYFATIDDEELITLMCMQDQGKPFHEVFLALKERGYHKKELVCARFPDSC